MALKFYKEGSDYLVVDTTQRYLSGSVVCYTGRGAAIEGTMSSVCSSDPTAGYLKTCKRVSRKDVPKEWLQALIGEVK